MIVSTKGRYALRVMVCFAQRGGDEYIPLKEIAESEGISQKYLESIMTTLSKAGFVDAVHGKGGGYRLNRPPEELQGKRQLFKKQKQSFRPEKRAKKNRNTAGQRLHRIRRSNRA